MVLSRNKLYLLLFIACLAGYIWLFFVTSKTTHNISVEVCVIKHLTSVPCPSCGSTRSVISLAKGNFREAFNFNPLGYIVASIMLVTPIWIAVDLATRKKTLFDFYKKIEIQLRKPKIAVTLILLVILNWIWNIAKEL